MFFLKKRLTLWRTEVQYLSQYRASQSQYLEVQGVDGTKRVMPGPCSMY